MSEKQKAFLRAIRGVLQSTVAAALIAGGTVVAKAVMSAKGWGDLDWSALGASATFLGVQGGVTYFWNKVLDPSAIPSLVVPPDPQV